MIPQSIWGHRLYIYGIILLLMAIAFAFHAILKKKRCSSKIEATVVDVKRKLSRHNWVYSPICEYYVNGISYRRTGPPHCDNVLPIGSSITIAYDPSKPERAYIPGRDDRIYKWRVIIMVVGSVMMFITGYLS